VDATQANAGEIANIVQRCPTGALHFRRTDGGVEEPTPGRNEVRITRDRPLYFRGELEIHTPTAVLKETRAALCRCGASRNKPFCDNSHADIAFRASDESGMTATALLAGAAVPAVFPPVLLDGRFLLDGGVSNNKPISIAVELGATRVIVLPTGISCSLQAPPAWRNGTGLARPESSDHAPTRQRHRTLRRRGRRGHRAAALSVVNDQLRLLAICRFDSPCRGRDEALASNGRPASPRRATLAVAAS
jgi:CDGSH-type Zn-finger protein